LNGIYQAMYQTDANHGTEYSKRFLASTRTDLFLGVMSKFGDALASLLAKTSL